MYKKGSKVKIVSCDLFPEFVGKVGEIELILMLHRNKEAKPLYRVICEGVVIPHYATSDCLELITE